MERRIFLKLAAIGLTDLLLQDATKVFAGANSFSGGGGAVELPVEMVNDFYTRKKDLADTLNITGAKNSADFDRSRLLVEEQRSGQGEMYKVITGKDMPASLAGYIKGLGVIRSVLPDNAKQLGNIFMTPQEQGQHFSKIFNPKVMEDANKNKKVSSIDGFDVNSSNYLKKPACTLRRQDWKMPFAPDVFLGQDNTVEYGMPGFVTGRKLGELDSSTLMMGEYRNINFADSTRVVVIGNDNYEPFGAVGFGMWQRDPTRRVDGPLETKIRGDYGGLTYKGDLKELSDSLSFIRVNPLAECRDFSDPLNPILPLTLPSVAFQNSRPESPNTIHGWSLVEKSKYLGVRTHRFHPNGTQVAAVTDSAVIFPTWGVNSPSTGAESISLT